MSRVEGNMSKVEGNISRVEGSYLTDLIIYQPPITFKFLTSFIQLPDFMWRHHILKLKIT